MRGESMKDKSKKSTYSTTFGVDPNLLIIYVERKQQNRYEKNISFFVSSKFYINL